MFYLKKGLSLKFCWNLKSLERNKWQSHIFAISFIKYCVSLQGRLRSYSVYFLHYAGMTCKYLYLKAIVLKTRVVRSLGIVKVMVNGTSLKVDRVVSRASWYKYILYMFAVVKSMNSQCHWFSFSTPQLLMCWYGFICNMQSGMPFWWFWK